MRKRKGLFLFLLILLCCLSALGLAAAFFPARRVVVLAYHDIGSPETGYRISRERFLSHIDALQHAGYVFLPLESVGPFIEGRLVPPRKSLVLTFDDGYKSFYQQVYPILRQRGIPAAVFLITGAVGQGRHLSWAEIEEMERDPAVHVRFYVHTHRGHGFVDADGDHVPDARFYVGRQWLPEKGRQETKQEYLKRITADLGTAREAIKLHLGHDSPYLALPGGAYSPAVAKVAVHEGYRYLFASSRGRFVYRESPSRPLPRVDAGSIRPDGRGVTASYLLRLLDRPGPRDGLRQLYSHALGLIPKLYKIGKTAGSWVPLPSFSSWQPRHWQVKSDSVCKIPLVGFAAC